MATRDWTDLATELNEQAFENYRRAMESQSTLVDAWLGATEEMTDEDILEEGVASYGRAYEVWLEAAGEALSYAAAAAEGERVDPETIRDVWLSAANEAAKEVMGSEAFAAATGQSVDNAMRATAATDRTAEMALQSTGLATRDDVQEVGERLVELERRQQVIEDRLEEVLAALDAAGGRTQG